MSLLLTPNKVVGYRIKPDWYSYNVVLVKLHGENSKNAGKEYETPLAYCRNIEFAAKWIFSHALRTAAELSQAEIESIEGNCADIRGLLGSVERAKDEVLRAMSELQARIDATGLSQKRLVQALGSAPAEGEPEPANP
jgi:hypothetical protein